MAVSLALTVNGKPVSADVDPRTLLVDFLRNQLRAHRHARRLRHRAVRRLHRASSTAAPSSRATCSPCRPQGAEVTTIEGLAAADGTLHPMQAAFKECHGLQCGFCTPGMVMSAIDLVQAPPERRRGDDPRGARRQPLPLHRLPQHRQGRAPGRRRDGRIGDDDGRQRSTGLASVIGQSVQRKEDARFLTGAGQYTDDVTLPRQTYAVLPALAARARDDPRDRRAEGEGGARRRRRSSPAPTSTGKSTACPAAG